MCQKLYLHECILPVGSFETRTLMHHSDYDRCASDTTAKPAANAIPNPHQ